MTKSVVYVLLLAAVVSTAIVGFMVLREGLPAPKDDQQVAVAETKLQALEASWDTELAARQEALAQLAAAVELKHYLHPEQAVVKRNPILLPNQPPQRQVQVEPIPRAQLEAQALQRLQQLAQGEGEAAFISQNDALLLVSGGDALPKALLPLLTGEGSQGHVFHEGQLYWVNRVRLDQDAGINLFVLSPVPAEFIQSLAAKQGAALTLVRRGEVTMSTAEDAALTAEITEAAATLRSSEALDQPPERFASPQSLDGQEVVHRRVLLRSLNDEVMAALVLTTTSSPSNSALTLSENPVIKNPGAYPQVWGAGAGILLLLAFIGVLLVRSDINGGFVRASKQLDAAFRIDDAKLSPAARRFAEAVRDLLKTSNKRPVAKEQANDKALVALNEEIASLQSASKQTKDQLGYARKEISRLQEALKEASSSAEPTPGLAAEDRKAYEEQIMALGVEIDGANARIRELEESNERLLNALATRNEAKTKEHITQELSGGAELKEYDTAEVTGEEMDQLLEEVDSETDEQDSESIEELAERIGSMSADQVAAMGIEPPQRVADEAPESIPDPGATARLWGIPSHRAEDENRRTLPGGLRAREAVASVRPAGPVRPPLEDDEVTEHATAPPPWRQGASPVDSLSPSNLLEALKKHSQNEAELGLSAGTPSSQGLLSEKTPVQSRRPKSLSQSGVFSQTGSRVDIDPANDTEYFKSLYQEFLDTKRRCGESTDRITLERFVNRLARNKQALMEQYECATVRFQVYVKDGKAALKATPVK